MPNYSNKKALVLFLIIVLLILIGLGLKECQKPIPYTPINIKEELNIRDSFRIVTRFHDSTRLHHVTNWHNRTRITDSMPCYTEVRYVTALCDTVIKYDSLLIQSLKGTVWIDSVIIDKCIERIAQDSVTIVKLNKKLKRQKLITKFAFGIGAILGSIGGYNAKP